MRKVICPHSHLQWSSPAERRYLATGTAGTEPPAESTTRSSHRNRLRVGYVPNRSKPGLLIEAGWIGDGIRLEVSAFRYDYGAISEGSIDIRRAARFNSLEDDAKQL